jgi:REP element-mobilizing transposase RayT
MPDHVHGIVEIKSGAEKPGDVVSGDEKSVSGDGKSVGANNYSPLHIPPSPPVSSPVSTPSRPTGTSRTIGAIVRGFKIGVTKQIGQSIWQRNYYEHIIREPSEYSRIVEYIRNNPTK